MKKGILFLTYAFLSGIILTGCTERIEEMQEGRAVGAISRTGSLNELVVADFDSGKKPNNVGGNFGAWDKDPEDPSQSCKDTFDSANRYGPKGFALKLAYDVDSKNAAYNGFWMRLNGFDVSGYDSVSFWVKGDKGAGYTTAFKIELKNAKNETGSYYVTNITDSWQNAIIPLKKMKGITDFSGLTEFVIVFEDKVASDKEGIIYIDNITFMANK